MTTAVIVVYRPFPTSNHNRKAQRLGIARVVYRPFPTSNHNRMDYKQQVKALYIVRFLHQTTTAKCWCTSKWRCISSVSYIKPQHAATNTINAVSCISSVSYIKPQQKRLKTVSRLCCISSVSYIKPQPKAVAKYADVVVYRPFPTSNHNRYPEYKCRIELYIVRFLHQTTTYNI